MSATQCIRFVSLLAISVVGALGGCATLVKGSSQSVIVSTDPPGAICTLSRKGKNIAVVNPTPGTVSVGKSRDNVLAVCTKTGYLDSQGTLASAFQPMTFGNILFGGLIGVVIDAGSGAMNEYGTSVTVTLIPAQFPSLTARDAFFDKMLADFAEQSDQVVARIKQKCQGSSCDLQLKAAATAREAKRSEIEAKRLQARVDGST